MPFNRSSNLRSKPSMKSPFGLRVLVALMMGLLLASLCQPALVRASDGNFDPGFGAGGTVTTDFLRGGEDHAYAIAIQTDEKIVVAGGNSGYFAVARYNPDGSLDSSFGNGGKVVTAFGTRSSTANAVSLQSNGKIVVVGSVVVNDRNGQDFALARYNADGSLDPSFDGDGKITTHLGDMSDGRHGAGAVAIQPADGKIIAAGVAYRNGTGRDFALARYNPDGSLDTAFGVEGKVTTDFNGQGEEISGIALMPDGRIVAAGTTAFKSNMFAVVRYTFDGSLDTGFGMGGRVVTGSQYLATAVALQSDGKIVVVGTDLFGFISFLLVRYNPDGSLDSSFGVGGIVV